MINQQYIFYFPLLSTNLPYISTDKGIFRSDKHRFWCDLVDSCSYKKYLTHIFFQLPLSMVKGWNQPLNLGMRNLFVEYLETRAVTNIRIPEIRISDSNTREFEFQFEYSNNYRAILFVLAFTIICFSNDKFGALLIFGKFINFERKTNFQSVSLSVFLHILLIQIIEYLLHSIDYKDTFSFLFNLFTFIILYSLFLFSQLLEQTPRRSKSRGNHIINNRYPRELFSRMPSKVRWFSLSCFHPHLLPLINNFFIGSAIDKIAETFGDKNEPCNGNEGVNNRGNL